MESLKMFNWFLSVPSMVCVSHTFSYDAVDVYNIVVISSNKPPYNLAIHFKPNSNTSLLKVKLWLQSVVSSLHKSIFLLSYHLVLYSNSTTTHNTLNILCSLVLCSLEIVNNVEEVKKKQKQWTGLMGFYWDPFHAAANQLEIILLIGNYKCCATRAWNSSWI